MYYRYVVRLGMYAYLCIYVVGNKYVNFKNKNYLICKRHSKKKSATTYNSVLASLELFDVLLLIPKEQL